MLPVPLSGFYGRQYNMNDKELADFRALLDLIFCAGLGALLIVTAIFGSIYWKSTKPPPRYANTLQRDINP